MQLVLHLLVLVTSFDGQSRLCGHKDSAKTLPRKPWILHGGVFIPPLMLMQYPIPASAANLSVQEIFIYDKLEYIL